jgi:hypothetical protein
VRRTCMGSPPGLPWSGGRRLGLECLVSQEPACTASVSVENMEMTATHRRLCTNAFAFVCNHIFLGKSLFFSKYTIHQRYPQHTHSHPYEYTHVNPTPRSIFEDCVGKSSRLAKSPQASRCRRERRLPLKAQRR